MNIDILNIKELLDYKVDLYNRREFIESDPISIPHLFSLKEDIEISGFLTATLSWGYRRTIISKSTELMKAMDFSPYDFVRNATPQDLDSLHSFRHRTFNGEDAVFFIRSIQNIYLSHGGLEGSFGNKQTNDIKERIANFRRLFFSIPCPIHCTKHISDPVAGSPAKRLNMFLRWMVRNDDRGVDFGIWKSISSSDLMCPLDLHSGNTARKLYLIRRRQNDWKALEELMANLRKFDPSDPVKYDYALFGLGVFEKF
ncbi:MAG: TIGR02757 family protein [Bacteroidales bacterium]|nr:TIGR02757 family protein [Bacteroidales bacterium]